jgi:hypothetical protein
VHETASECSAVVCFGFSGLEPWDSAFTVSMEIGSDINRVGILRLRIRMKQNSYKQ